MSLLACENLSKSYGSSPALRHISLTLEGGKIIGLLGPNGSGKTTFIKIASGLLSPSEGTISIDGSKIGPETKAVVSYLPDRLYFEEWMTIRHLHTLFADYFPDFDSQKAFEMLEELHISPDKKIAQLSKGNREKVQLILTMSRRAKLYLLDEPIASVDPAAREYIMNTILKSSGENSSILISTHLISEVEQILQDVIFLNSGNIILHDSASAVREQKGKSLDEYFREVFKC